MGKPPDSPRLGRGLSALLATFDVESAVGKDGAPKSSVDRQFLPVGRIVANPRQPRKTFDEAALGQLAESLRQKGIIQPLIVRPIADTSEFEIVAGERRWRAAQQAGLTELPVVIRDFDDAEVLQIAVIENIQRADLNPLEEAEAYRDLMDRFGHTQEQLAEGLSKSRSHIANLLRLLNLPSEVQDFVRQGHLSMGHARALITASDPVELAKHAVEQRLSVREVETLVQRSLKAGRDKRQKPNRAPAEDEIKADEMRHRLTENLGMDVAIAFTSGRQRGTLKISFASQDELEFLCEVLANAKQGPPL